MSVLFCSVNCVWKCGIVCTADLFSPILDAIGLGVSETAELALA